jgi:hypothetical protein
MDIIYDSSIPEPLLPLIRERVSQVTPFFPTWCHEVNVLYESDSSSDAMLSCKSNYSYRFVNITVYDYWFKEPDWQLALLHELLHVLLSPYTFRVERLIETFITDTEVKKYITNELVDAEEFVAQDSAYLLRKLTKLNK